MLERLCYGYNHKLLPCEHIDTCDMIININRPGDDCEEYIIGLGRTSEKCKRDNPNFRPMTKHEFIEAYKRLSGRTMDVSLQILWDTLRVKGLVENHEYGRNY